MIHQASQQMCFCSMYTLGLRRQLLIIYILDNAYIADGCSLQQVTEILNTAIQSTARSPHYPMDQAGLLSRNDDPNDFSGTPWKAILAGTTHTRQTPPKLSFAKTEERVRSHHHIKIRRVHDIDSAIIGISTLAVHNSPFWLSLRPSYLRSIT